MSEYPAEDSDNEDQNYNTRHDMAEVGAAGHTAVVTGVVVLMRCVMGAAHEGKAETAFT
jgi:hypothetical protein